MEEILEKILVTDNAIVQQGTEELKEALKHPDVVTALLQVLVTSTKSNVRQMAAVVLRKKLNKRFEWSKQKPELKQTLKREILQIMVKEPVKLVKNVIAQVIGTIGKHESISDSWPDLLQFISRFCNSESPAERELGMYTLSIITDLSAAHYAKHMESFAFLFRNNLEQETEFNSNIVYYTIITMKNFVTMIKGHQQMINVYHNLLPYVMESIKAFALSDPDKACEVMELLDDLIDDNSTVIVPHIKSIIELLLQLATKKEVPDSVKVKALSMIGWLIRSKSKVIQRNKLLESILDVLFMVMSSKPEDDSDEEYFCSDPDNSSPMTCATQTLDVVALHIPAEKLITYLLQHIEPALNSDNLYARKAAFLSIAVLAEGCSEKIRTKYLQLFLRVICKGITEENIVVRNAALFALGQFAEHLQPEISQYASDLLPVLFQYLSQVCLQLQNQQLGNDISSVDRMFYALEMFCENLDKGLLPYLDQLMERLLFILSPENQISIHLRELALSAIAAAANAAKDKFMPYFEKVIDSLKIFLTANEASELACTQAQAVDTLSVIARSLGRENFMPLAQESLKLAIALVTNTDDPDVRKSAYGLFASLATVLGDSIASALPQIVEQMIESIKSSDGIVTVPKDSDSSGLYEISSDDDEDIGTDTSNEDDDAVAGYSVENAYLEEKEEACLALKEIAECAGRVFLPFLENSFEEIFKLLNYPQEDIRKAATLALCQFCITLSKVNAIEGRQALHKALQVFVPKCAELIRADEERMVTIVALEAYSDLLKAVGRDVLVGEGHREAIINCIIDVMMYRTACQDQDNCPDIVATEDAENDEEAEAEQDEVLQETAVDIIPLFGKTVGSEEFSTYFPNILKLLIPWAKKQNSVSQRSFVMGTLAECMISLGPRVAKFADQLLPVFLQGSRDPVDEVRNNAIFGLGEFVLHGQEAVYSFYGKILETLSEAISKEKDARILDNICGALARMILCNKNAIPMQEVFPVFMHYLPLRVDFEENKAVFKCFLHLYQQGDPHMLQHLPKILKIGASLLYRKQTFNQETESLVGTFLKLVQQDFHREFSTVVANLEPELAESLQLLFQNL